MRKYIMLSVILLSAPSLSYAQTTTPAFDVSGGYSFLRDSDAEENFHGWVASVTGNINQWLGIVGEVGGNYKTVDFFGTDLDLSLHSFMAGPKVVGRTNPAFTPFGQVLVGAARLSFADFLGEDDSATEFAIQPGAGVDIWLRPNLGVRIGGDYRRIFVDDDVTEDGEGGGVNEFRFYVGIVLSGGSR